MTNPEENKKNRKKKRKRLESSSDGESQSQDSGEIVFITQQPSVLAKNPESPNKQIAKMQTALLMVYQKQLEEKTQESDKLKQENKNLKSALAEANQSNTLLQEKLNTQQKTIQELSALMDVKDPNLDNMVWLTENRSTTSYLITNIKQHGYLSKIPKKPHIADEKDNNSSKNLGLTKKK